jgi:hypothetical protein
MSNATDSQQHGRPAGNVPAEALPAAAPSHAERARTLIEGVASATLCTLAREPAGYPYGSLVTFALQSIVPSSCSASWPSTPRTCEQSPGHRCS